VEERKWALEAVVAQEEVRDMVRALGFAGVESPTDLKLLRALVEVLKEPEAEGIMVGNVLAVLKAVMKLSSNPAESSSITPLKVIDMSGDYAAVGRDDMSSLNASGDKSMIFSSFLGGTHAKRLTFGEDHKVMLTSREQHWLSSYFTLLARNRQDA